MKLAEAIKLASTRQDAACPPQEIALACGFEALHLKTFLLARACRRFPARNVTLSVGLYGSLMETLKNLSENPPSAVAVVLEWSDLDPRLGFRASANVAADGKDVMVSVARQIPRLARLIRAVADKTVLVFVPPHYPLPTHFSSGSGRLSSFEANLRFQLAGLVNELSSHRNIRILGDVSSDGPDRSVSLRMLFRTGFPYTTGWASCLSHHIFNLMFPTQPKKGIITDLDGTLWRGILGEDGVDGISWTLETDAQGHGHYQQLLSTLARQGVLIAIVSKNEPANVEQALSRADLIVDRNQIFPVKASWERKSLAVGEVLAAWNVLPDSVVFVDDNQMELNEVQSRFADITPMLYPTDDDDQLPAFLGSLRDHFEDREPREEDLLRLESIRTNAEFIGQANASDDHDHETFLLESEPRITASFAKQGSDGRAFELVNKTNQFNLNGVRYQPDEWNALMERTDSFLLSLAYEDKFGPLGTIAVVVGNNDNDGTRVLSWVMSCRAFSRRIEYQHLAVLFKKFHAEKIELDFTKTTRNGPFTGFLSPLLEARSKSCMSLDRRFFEDACPHLYHKVGYT
jgi:FkbH-like protein